jgi:hypothetical protein
MCTRDRQQVFFEHLDQVRTPILPIRAFARIVEEWMSFRAASLFAQMGQRAQFRLVVDQWLN